MKHKLLLSLALTLGLASNTWALDQVGGVYQIGSAQDLRDFATLVNTGGDNMSANAVLINDIDMQGVSSWEPIGNWVNSCAYKGHFNGQGYKIENVNITSFSRSYHGLFGIISTGCLIENFSIYGEMTFGVANAGTIAAYARDATPTIRNVHSFVTIKDSQTNQNRHHAGIVGTVQKGTSAGGTTVIERCSYSGTLSVSTTNNNANYGGIVGFVQSDTTAVCNITDCLFDGTLENTSSTPGSCSFGGIVGYCSSGKTTITNCLSVGTVSAKAGRFGQLFGIANSDKSSTKIYNSYYVGANANGTDSKTPTPNEATLVTAAQLPSGEVAYLLNESTNGGTSWRQTLLADTKPTLDSTHGLVYLIGTKCPDGTPHDDIEYSNTAGSITEAHNYVDGICSYCKGFDLTFVSKDSEDYYEIGTPAQLKWFSAWVNSSSDNTTSKAVLTADIDMGDIAATWVPIGDWHTGVVTSAYKGHFNGQGYELSNFNVTTSQNYYGIFGVVSAATIENFSIRGTITNNDYTNIGVIGYSRDTSVNINNIQSYLTITNNGNDKNAGGILGSGNAGTTNIDRCAFFGTINAVNKTNAGGIVGYFANGNTSIVNITNCLFNGTITSEISNAYCGGIAGYGGANVNGVKIESCLSLGTLTASVTGQFFGNIRNVGSSITNCYYQGDNINGTGSSPLTTVEATAVTPEQLSSGEVCYALNGDQSTIVWHQTLPATPSGDATPTLDSTHGLVYVNGTVCPDTGTPQGTVSYSNSEGTTLGEHVPVDGFCIYCGTVYAKYLTANSDGFYEISNKKELVWFAALVNAGKYDAKAKLTADIDMNGADISHFPIGDASATSKYFTGTFDGQGHKLSNFKLVNASAPTNYGMFNATTGVVLKNFWLDSSCAIEGREMVGLIGHLYGGGTLEGIGNCADVTGIQNNIGGLIGGVTGNSGSKKDITIKNCWTTGKVETTNPSASNGKDCGALTGWFNNAIISIEGFWTVADVVNPRSANTYVYRNGAGASFTISNSFSKKGEQANYTNFTDEQLANGWLCYGLNGSQSNIAWYQTIGTDANPVLDSSREKVLYVGAAGYSTFYDADNDWALSSYNDDAKAFIGTLTPSGGALHLEEIDDIPAGTAVIISGTYYNKVSTTATATTTGNVLKGSDGFVTGDGSTIFALANGENGVGFYPVGDGVTIPAGKAYLVDGSLVKGFTFVFDDDATAIEMVNGQWSMVNDQTIYNVAGQRLNKMQKGINIVNGKKVMVK